GVAAGRERMAFAAQLLAQGGEVVRLAVERDGDSVADHGLIARLEVQDGEPEMAQSRGTVEEEPVRVRPAMRDGPRSAAHALRVRSSVQIDIAADPAHQCPTALGNGFSGRFSSSAMR